MASRFNRLTLSLVAISLATSVLHAQSRTDAWLDSLLRASGNPFLVKLLDSPDLYRLQIIYTRIDRRKNQDPVFTDYHFNTNPNLYFNPASTVKLPLALLALEKLHRLRIPGVNRNTAMRYDSSYAGQSPYIMETSAENGKPSIAHLVKQVLLVSENGAYNRLYEFLGQQHINRSLHAKGYQDVRITRRFLGMSPEENRHTNAIHFLDKEGKEIYYQPPAYNPDSFHYPAPITVGLGHYDRNDSLVMKPIDFTGANHITLASLKQVLQSALFPASVPAAQRFDLSAEDRAFMKQYLSQFPGETNYPKYDGAVFYDSYVKFFFRDSAHPIPPGVRVFNKVGWAYGFLTDVSYVADFTHQVEFMLAATVYVNKDGILNDNRYDYDDIGYPFLYALGQTIYRYELQRNRAVKPRLDDMRVRYEQQQTDGRPLIRKADND